MKHNDRSTRTCTLVTTFFLSLGLLAAWPSSRLRAAPQSAPAPSAHLDSVLITGSQRFTSAQIASAVGLRVGAEVNRDTLQGAADKLAELGLFSNIQYRFSTVLTGVKVTYEVADAPLLPVTFDNFPWASDADFSAGLKASGILFNGSAPAKGTILDAMSDALVHTLDQRGIHVHVVHQVITMPVKNQMVQQFRVDDVDLTVQSIEFNDPLAKNDRAIQASLADLVGKPYSRSRVELFEFEQVRPVYLAHSYLQVQFGPTTAQFASKSPEFAFRPLDHLRADYRRTGLPVGRRRMARETLPSRRPISINSLTCNPALPPTAIKSKSPGNASAPPTVKRASSTPRSITSPSTTKKRRM